MRVAGCIAIAAGMLGGTCQAQVFDASEASAALEGFRLYGVSVFSGYSSSAFPDANLNPVPGAGKLNSTVNYGASASAGWQRNRGKTSVSLRYGITYGGSSNYRNLNALNHALSFNVSRPLTSKLSLSFSASGNNSTVAQLIYQPSTLGIISQTPTSFR